MEPDERGGPPPGHVLDLLFASCLDVLIYGAMPKGLKFRALVSIALIRRSKVINKASLAQAFEDVERAIEGGEAGEVTLGELLRLDHRDDSWKRIREQIDLKSRIALIKNKGKSSGEDETFRGAFSKHANRIIAIASYLVAEARSEKSPIVKDYFEYKICCIDKADLTFALRSFRLVHSESGYHRTMANLAREVTTKQQPSGGWAIIESEADTLTIASRNPSTPPPVVPRGDFCRFTQAFIDVHRANIRILDDQKVPLRLFYLLFQVRDFEGAKLGIQALANDHCRAPKPGDREGLTDISLWSVLGETDLVLRFRAVNREAAEAFYQKAALRLRDDGTGEEGPGLNPRLIIVERELVNGLYSPEASRSFYEASKHHLVHLDMNEHRYTKYFVFIRYISPLPKPEIMEDHVRNVRGIIEPSADLSSIVESISPAKNRDGPGEAWMVIEGQLPCGMFSRLKTLSKKLEADVSGGKGSKETFVAYDLVFYDHHERDLQITGLA